MENPERYKMMLLPQIRDPKPTDLVYYSEENDGASDDEHTQTIDCNGGDPAPNLKRRRRKVTCCKVAEEEQNLTGPKILVGRCILALSEKAGTDRAFHLVGIPSTCSLYFKGVTWVHNELEPLTIEIGSTIFFENIPSTFVLLGVVLGPAKTVNVLVYIPEKYISTNNQADQTQSHPHTGLSAILFAGLHAVDFERTCTYVTTMPPDSKETNHSVQELTTLLEISLSSMITEIYKGPLSSAHLYSTSKTTRPRLQTQKAKAQSERAQSKKRARDSLQTTADSKPASHPVTTQSYSLSFQQTTNENLAVLRQMLETQQKCIDTLSRRIEGLNAGIYHMQMMLSGQQQRPQQPYPVQPTAVASRAYLPVTSEQQFRNILREELGMLVKEAVEDYAQRTMTAASPMPPSAMAIQQTLSQLLLPDVFVAQQQHQQLHRNQLF